MKVTGIPICPPNGTEKDYQVTPELLASVLAKYSRSNEGIDKILSNVNWENPDKAVDTIFKFIDYGHASIGGLTGGIAIAVDDISMLLAYKIFEIAQQCDGQESSTRYITLEPTSLPDPSDIGIPDKLHDAWTEVMTECFETYGMLYNELDRIAKDNPSKTKIPDSVKGKARERMIKNYALDRARSFIPLATKTSAAYVMTARVWADTLKRLESLPLIEAQECAKSIRLELNKFAPRLIKHSYPDEASKFHGEASVNMGMHYLRCNDLPIGGVECECDVSVDMAKDPMHTPEGCFRYKTNRYSEVSSVIKRSTIRVNWSNMSIAELRDLNRHRTGNRYSTMIPKGFYLPDCIDRKRVEPLLKKLQLLSKKIAESDESGVYLYSYLLGTEVDFEHSTHLDKMIYEIELRTGLGAHFRYAEHLEAAYHKLIAQQPQLKPYIELGTAEPE
jgi:thymidylate synthase ThyX